ncbi:MAG: hypothetical protein A2156_14985 [Deltaproteobacteria bacterium RBG_16_48_10]|nr:MAG: hypothetical protein A2156_14985 [Deltaproteobacteria bacterium RBG_16_48_10]
MRIILGQRTRDFPCASIPTLRNHPRIDQTVQIQEQFRNSIVPRPIWSLCSVIVGCRASECVKIGEIDTSCKDNGFSLILRKIETVLGALFLLLVFYL